MVKYELDKESGLLQVDRVQQTSSSPPTLYGLIPKTYCGPKVADLSSGADRADGDPLDICVLSEQPIDKADIVLQARVIGGLRMLDQGEADDKIVAVLDNDPFFSGAETLEDAPTNVVDRLDHYFRTYKLVSPDDSSVTIESHYGRKDALKVVSASIEDYNDKFA